MILDTLDNLPDYLGISKNLDQALLWLQETDLKTLCPGIYPISGEDIFCRAVEAQLYPGSEIMMEVHRRYLDIHVALEPGEQIAVLNRNEIKEWSEYDTENDAQTAMLPQGGTVAVLCPGMFAVCFPQDAHCPLLTAGKRKTVKKLIVKVRHK